MLQLYCLDPIVTHHGRVSSVRRDEVHAQRVKSSKYNSFRLYAVESVADQLQALPAINFFFESH